jgi:transcriptional regulator with XRE-family HTH domain
VRIRREAEAGLMLAPNQCREARLLLGWTAERLGAMAGVSGETIRNFEGRRRPSQIQTRTGAAISAALEAAGIIFVDEDGKQSRATLREVS